MLVRASLFLLSSNLHGQMFLNRQKPLPLRAPAEDTEAASARPIAELLQQDLYALSSFDEAQRF